MNLFNLCCHSKSKKSLEYINDWINTHSLAFNSLSAAVTSLQTWKDTLNNDIVKIVEDIANTYDYTSAIPQLTTLSNDIKDLQSGLNSLDVLVNNKLFNFSSTLNTLQKSMANKVDVAIPTTANSIALLDSVGNLVDSGKTLKDIFVRPDAIVNNTYGISIDSDGEAHVSVTSIVLGGDFSINGDLEIYPENVPNIKRVLLDPDSVPIQNSDKLITSGAVYKALELKTLALTDSDGSVPGFLEPFDEEEFSKLANSIGGKNDPTFVEVTLYIHVNGERVPLKTIGSVFKKSNQVGPDSYDDIFYLYINGYVLVRAGQTNNQETTWEQGFTKINILSENS